MKNEIRKVGIVAMPKISVGGGFAKVTIDLINALNELGMKVHLLTPFKLDINKIKELYGPIILEKVYYPNKIISELSREDLLGRKLLKREFVRMASEVDFIIDLEGLVLHNFLPKDFKKENYVVYRLSCINPETHKLQKVTNWKILVKKYLKKIIRRKKDIPRSYRVYPLDEWTKKEIEEFWEIKTEWCMYPAVNLKEFNPKTKKDNQAVILGRIAPNKSIQDSIEIFYNATKDSNYKLVIIGGKTPDTEAYLIQLEQLINKLGIESKVKIIVDPSFNLIKETLNKSKIIIDSQKGTSMNIPVVEAMAAGCIPLMQENSGTFTEILGSGKYGQGFKDIKEGSDKLKKIINNQKSSINTQVYIKRAEFFSKQNFIKRLRKIIFE